ncbi:hypothetical protein [Intestinibacter bartlettii]|uniref:histidine kinase n=2 Tax=root TaxID=1 RepID=A0A6N2ZG64_9FIRM
MSIYIKLISIAICTCCLCLVRFIFNNDNRSIVKHRFMILGTFWILQVSSIFLESFYYHYKLIDILSVLSIFCMIIIYNRKHIIRRSLILSLYTSMIGLNLFLIDFKINLSLDDICNFIVIFFAFHREIYFYNKKIYKKCKSANSELNRLKIITKLRLIKLDTLKSENKKIEDRLYFNNSNFKSLLSDLNMDIYFIDQSLTNIYEYTVESNSLYKISEFNNFFNTEIFSNLKILEMIYNVLYDCEEHGFEIKDEKGRYYNCRLIPNTLIQGTLGVLLIKENVSEQYNIKAIHEQKYNEFKSIIDNIPYDLILEKDKKIIYQNKKIKYEDNMLNLLLDKNINGDIIYNQSEDKENNFFIKRINLDNQNENLIILKDLSEHNSLVTKMKLSKQKYESFVDIIPEGVIIIDNNSKKIKYTNKSLNYILEKYNLNCVNIYSLIENSQLNYCDLLFNMRFENKKITNYLNEEIHFEFANMVLNINNKNIIIGLFRDITQNINNNIIKKKIEEETYIHKMKNDFLINLSHELKTPVNLIYLKNQLTRSLCEKNSIVDIGQVNLLNKELKNIKVLMNLVESIISLEKLNLNFYEDNRDYHNIVEILENIAIKLNKYEDINIIFDTDSEEIFVLIDPYNLIKVIARLISIVCKYSNNKALISFDIKQNKDKINIHIYNKNKTKENITENEANVMETAAILCKLVLNLYGGKLEIKQRFNDVNIELQSVNNIDYTLRNGLELIKEDFIEEEFQKIYNL